MDILDALAPEIGDPPVYKKAGYLFLTSDAAKLAAMRDGGGVAARARRLRRGPRRGGRAREGAVAVAGAVAGGTFGARDGFIDPGGLCNFFLREATRAGADHRAIGAEVLAIERDRSGASACTPAAARFARASVVNAAGAWAKQVAAMLGVALPGRAGATAPPHDRPCPALPPLIPMTIDADTGVLVRREGERILIAYSNPDEPAGYNTTFDPAFGERIAGPLEAALPRRVGRGIDLRRSWAGLYEVTPDHHSVLGAARELPGSSSRTASPVTA